MNSVSLIHLIWAMSSLNVLKKGKDSVYFMYHCDRYAYIKSAHIVVVFVLLVITKMLRQR